VRIQVDREVCIGAGNCARTAPELFDQDDDGTVVLLQDRPAPAQEEAAREAEGLCPSGAISLSQEAGRPDAG
jgi:ferredoxin